MNTSQFRTMVVGSVTAALNVVVAQPVAGQASASPYTSAVRYDAMGREVGTIAPDPDGTGPLKYPATRTTYDDRGNVIRIETGELQVWKSEAVLPSSWSTSEFKAQARSEITYDASNRKTIERVRGCSTATCTTETWVSVVQYSYDNRGRLECTAQRMNSAAFGSLPASACTLGAEGSEGPDRITKTIYDPAGQVLQIRRAVGTPIELAEVTYTYTDNGQIAQVIDANGNRAERRYDGFDRQVRWVFPSKTAPSGFNAATPAQAVQTAGVLNEADYESYGYDANGNRTSFRKRDGSTLTFQYDDLNRVIKKTIPSRTGLSTVHTRNVYYDYDLRGLQITARFNNWTTGPGVAYEYDGFGRLTSETQTTDGTARTVTSQYDANGNRVRVTHPDGAYWKFDFDGLDRATNVRQSNLIMGTASYDERGLPEQLSWTYATTSANARSFGYDNAGRLASIDIDLDGTGSDVTWGYTRNPASQIVSESQTNDAYRWDGQENVDRSYTINGLNQYTSAGPASFCYDANGNLTADGTSVYLYDVENRLVQRRVQTNTNCGALSYSGSLKAELRYDPTGRLYQVSGGSLGTQRFVYDGNALIGEYNGSGALLRRYVHGSNVEADDPLIVYEGSAVTASTRRYIHSDPRGSIVAVTDYRGQIKATNTYDDFGIADLDTTDAGTDITTKGRFRYTGQAWLPELGMYYYKARIYSPTLGRFLQTDPIGYEDQFNLYAYVGNDPVNGVDPTGESITVTCTFSKGELKSCTASQQDNNVDKVYLTIATINSDGSIDRRTKVIGKESDLRSGRDLARNVQSAFKELYNLDVALSVGPAATAAGTGRGSARQPFQNEGEARRAARENGWKEDSQLSPGGRGKFYRDKNGNLWTRDRPRGSTGTSDKGGAWKKYNRTGTKRLGTYDRNLNRIGN